MQSGDTRVDARVVELQILVVRTYARQVIRRRYYLSREFAHAHFIPSVILLIFAAVIALAADLNLFRQATIRAHCFQYSELLLTLLYTFSAAQIEEHTFRAAANLVNLLVVTCYDACSGLQISKIPSLALIYAISLEVRKYWTSRHASLVVHIIAIWTLVCARFCFGVVYLRAATL